MFSGIVFVYLGALTASDSICVGDSLHNAMMLCVQLRVPFLFFCFFVCCVFCLRAKAIIPSLYERS